MTNLEMYKQAFCETLEITEERLNGLKYRDVETWDSIGHMGLITKLEEIFDIMMDTDDIVNFTSYEKGQEILSLNYDVKF